MFMSQNEKFSTGILNSCDKLRKLIVDNPELPLIVFAGEEANSEGCNYMTCGLVIAEIGEYLDCMQTVNDERCYCDRDEFREDIEYLAYEYFEGEDEDFDKYVDAIMAEYEPYWKKCIAVYVNN